jgi:hypothetical protein
MNSVVVIVSDELRQKPPEMALVQGKDVVQQLTSATANPAFRNPFCQGLWKEVRSAAIPMECMASGTSIPYFASRSKMRNRRAVW